MGDVQAREEEARRLMPPPPPGFHPRRAHHTLLPGEAGPKAVLAEDEFTAQIEAIIERDYFPDIPKLQNQLEWVKAVNSGDPGMIRQAQINIARRRAGLKTPAMTPGTGAWGATPGTTLFQTPSMTPLAAAGGATPALHAGMNGGATPHGLSAADAAAHAAAAAAHAGISADELRALPMSLDTFLAAHTSEDNASFSRLQDKANEKKRRKVAHYLEGTNPPLLLEGPGSNPTEEYGTGGQEPGTLVVWKHNPTPSLYYPPSQQPLSSAEAQQLIKGPPKAINIKGTRLKPGALEPEGGLPAALAAAVGAPGATPAAAAGAGRGGKDWDRLATPALTPGALGESPFMTWGDIASTPLRLDPVEEGGVVLDPSALQGPSFAVQAMPKREQVGHELAAAKTIKELRKRQKERAEAASLGMGSLPPGAGASLAGSGLLRSLPRPGSGATATPGRGVPAMSPAAQKLAAKMAAQRGGTGGRTPGNAAGAAGSSDMDKQLRASYSGLGAGGTGSARPTPSRMVTPSGTPSASMSRGSTPLVSSGGAGGSASAKAGAAAAAAAGGGKHKVSIGSLTATAKAGPGATGAAAASKGITDDLLKF